MKSCFGYFWDLISLLSHKHAFPDVIESCAIFNLLLTVSLN